MNSLQNISTLISNLSDITGVSFVSTVYTNEQNEIQKTVFNVNVSYKQAQAKDIEYLKTLDVTSLKSGLGKELLEQARQALLGALISPNKARSNGQKNAYTHLTNGLKIHNETNELYVVGMKVKKTVLLECDYKADTRKPLTVAKDTIRKGMKSTKYRNYKIKNAFNFKLKGDTLFFD
jgi:hypothetical protein